MATTSIASAIMADCDATAIDGAVHSYMLTGRNVLVRYYFFRMHILKALLFLLYQGLHGIYSDRGA